MSRYRREGPDDPYAQFVATGLAYVDYAMQHRARFQLMFRSDRLDFENPRLASAASRAYSQLEETLEALPAPGGSRALSLRKRAATAWSIVHGFATLTLENELFASHVGETEGGARESLRRMLLASKPVFAEESRKTSRNR
jgi:AcrR family transcriptional regulator